MSSSPSLAGSDLVQKTVNILDSVNWAAQGNHKAADYKSYIQEKHADEIGLMDGLLGEFLQKVLGFNLLNDLQQQQTQKTTGGRPDYIPDDTHLHPFVFDAKGSDTANLDSHYKQIEGYIVAQGVPYGILSNMRELAVYVAPQQKSNSTVSQARVMEFGFRFDQLYDDYKNDTSGATVLNSQNGERFLRFVERFSRRELDEDGKVQAIMDARHGSHDATLDADDLDDLVRRLHGIVDTLHDDAKRYRQTFPKVLGVDFRRERIALEIDVIAREISPSLPERDIDAGTLDASVQAPDGTPDAQAVDRYFYRVAYFSMTRIMLARVWEDTNLIDQTLYDGGFKKWYGVLDRKISKVLDQAFLFAEKRYSWLYGIENNYTWYTPSETTLVDVLYDFSRFDLSRLDADVLGAVYEAYLDETDRKNKGQYYTPRSMVGFIWDRVGFTNEVPTSIFRYEAGERKERVVLDFCTGSGGFLVEAARRIRETALGASFDHDSPSSIEEVSTDDLELAIRAILGGLRGSEISPFAYYLTEVNLLIQLTPVVAALQSKMQKVPAAFAGQNSTLSVIHQDALKLHNSEQNTISGLSEEHKRSDEVYEQDKRHDIVALDEYKREVYDHIKGEQSADYVCSNPPYVGEKGHKELFRQVRESIPYWKEYYQGKMDYLYWFVILGVSKLRERGRLGYITTNYWPTADGAAKLRRYILEHAKIVEVIDFRNTRIFSDALGQNNMVFVLERCSDEQERESNRPRIVRVQREFVGNTNEQRLTRLLQHIQDCIDAESYEDDYISSFISDVSQGELSSDSWSFTRDSVNKILKKIEQSGPGLSTQQGPCNVNSGAQSGADRLSKSKMDMLSTAVIKNGVRVGEGIFVLSEDQAQNKHLLESPLTKRLYKNSDLAPYVVDDSDDATSFLIYTNDNVNISRFPIVKEHLLPFKPILEARRECQQGRRLWSSLQWPREQAMFESPKLLNPQRASRNVFAYSEGPAYASVDVYYTTLKEGMPESLKYICALLNSALCRFWLWYRGKIKGEAFELYHKPLSNIPIRRIRFEVLSHLGDKDDSSNFNQFTTVLNRAEYDSAHALLSNALQEGRERIVHDGIECLVDQIIALKDKLIPYNQYFGTRLTRLDEEEPLPDIAPLGVLEDMDDSEKWTLDMHITNGTLRITEDFAKASLTSRDDFYFYQVGKKESDDRIVLQAKGGKKADTIALEGGANLISYLYATLPDRRGRFWQEVKNTPMPRDIQEYEKEVRRIENIVEGIREDIAALQRVIDEFVLDLYGIEDPAERSLILGMKST